MTPEPEQPQSRTARRSDGSTYQEQPDESWEAIELRTPEYARGFPAGSHGAKMLRRLASEQQEEPKASELG